MSDYSKSTNFTAKDSTNATVLGAEHDTEYNAIQTAIATKANKVASPTTGNIASLTGTGDIQDSGVAASQVTTNASNIATNTADIATNTADIATLDTSVTNIEAGVTATVYTAESVGTGTSKTKSLSGTVEEIEVTWKGLSATATGYLLVRLGSSGTLKTSGYSGRVATVTGTNTCTLGSIYSNGFGLDVQLVANSNWHGRAVFRHLGSNLWVCTIHSWESWSTSYVYQTVGYVTLAGACNIVGLSTSAGVFDTGTWAVNYRRSA